MRQWLREKFNLCTFKNKRNNDEDNLIWDIALKPHAFGDYSISVVQANFVLEDQSQVVASPSQTLIGVYDGHGGPEASRFVREHLLHYINQFAMEEGGINEGVIRKAFNATEEGFVHLVKQAMDTRPRMASVGTCCLFGAIAESTLYVANLGDSRVVLGRKGAVDGECTTTTTTTSSSSSVMAERLTTDHNVAEEEVRQEVKAQHPDDAHIVLNCRGVWRIKGIIQVSRSIGDVYLKKPELQKFYPISLKRPVMSAEPSIIVRKLRPEDMFLIFASDGLWEQLSDEEAVNIVSRSPRAGVAKRLIKAALIEAAKNENISYEGMLQIPKGSRRACHDDITVIVIYLDQLDISSFTNKPRPSDFSTHSTAPPVDIFSSNTSIDDVSDMNTM